MVYQPAKRSALTIHRRRIPFYLSVFIVSVIIGFFLGKVLFQHDSSKNNEADTVTSQQPADEKETKKPTTKSGKPLIDLQPVVDDWLATIQGTAGVVIYDIDNGQTVAEYNSAQLFGTASLYKLFVAYEGYRQAEKGLVNLNDQNYVGTYTRGECLDLMLRESYSPCAEKMWEEIGRDELERIIAEDFKLKNTTGLASTPTDIAIMMNLYYKHPGLSAKTWEVIKDTMLNQPATEYDWRQGLPSGFSNSVNVYNKVGFEYSGTDNIWNLYHDAAIVEFPDLGRHYIMVVMTSHVTPAQIAQLAAAIETAVQQGSAEDD